MQPDQALAEAAALESAGRTDDARRAYLSLLAQAPDHPGALTHLGALLFRTGYRSAALSAFARAAFRHPDRPEGHVKLAHLLREDGDLIAAARHYRAALRLLPDLAEAHQGFGNVLFDQGETEQAEYHWARGYRDHVFSTWPYRGEGPPVRVLLPCSVRGGNLQALPLLDPSVFAVTTVAMEFYYPGLRLPPHDLVFNAIGDADLCRPALHATAALAAATPAPVLNRPDAVLPTARHANARRLSDIVGLRVPRTDVFARAAISPAVLAENFGWPVLLRAPGYHTGKNFFRLDGPEDFSPALAELPGAEVLAIEYIPPTHPDGLHRKYRVMWVDGALYPLHLALSPEWKVHYVTSAMANSAEYRAEEERFLADMAATLGPAALATLRAVFARLGLDYAGIDFALGPAGEVVLYEANATMAIVHPDKSPIWDYRRPAIARVVDATVAMARRRAA